MEMVVELDLTAHRTVVQVEMEEKNILESRNRYFLNPPC